VKLIEILFHSNAVALLLVALIAYYTDGAMLIAAILFCLAILTEAALLFFKDDADPVTSAEHHNRRIKLKVARIKAKQLKKKREQYLCNGCKRKPPVLNR
jgi:hypothetical protein